MTNNLPDNALADESWKRLDECDGYEEIAQYWRLQAKHARKLVRALRRSPAGGEAVEVVARQHIPGCPLSEVSIELASCPCAIDDTGIIAAVLAHVSAEGGMLKVDVSAARAAIEALTRLGVGVDGGWRPIETAPKDGSTILIYSTDGDEYIIDTAVWNNGIWASACNPMNALVTHWRPLPSPPSPSPEPAPTDTGGEG